MKEKFIRFMYGRNGVDELARFESFLIWIPILLSIFIRTEIIKIIGDNKIKPRIANTLSSINFVPANIIIFIFSMYFLSLMFPSMSTYFSI